MIRIMFTEKSGDNTLLIGLSHANLTRLREQGLAGFVKIDLDKPVHKVLVTAASTELEMMASLQEFIGPNTELTIDPKLKS